MNNAHKISDSSTFFTYVAALTPLVISKKPNTRVRKVVGIEILCKNDDMQPIVAAKKTTYAHTVSIDMADDETADVKTETVSLCGA